MSNLRRIATLTAVGLASAGLVGVSTQPASAAEGFELRWGISQYLNEHLTGQTFTDGATAADGVVTFVDGVADDGSVRYSGTARYAFAMGGAELYSYAFSDVTVTLGDGTGTIAADVAWTAPTGPGTLDDVVVTTFSTDDDWSDGSLSATPDWVGVAPADTYGEGKPVDGASWAVDFVKALPSSVQASFYASGSNPTSDAKKFPAAFTASAETQASPSVTTTSAYAGNAVTIGVSGTGFTGVTNPGDDGVYASLAVAGEFPETDDIEDQDKVVTTQWIRADQMSDGTFEVTLAPAAKDLDPRKTYSVYTWQAHSHSNPSQDTETRVAIDFSKVGKATKLKAAKKGKKLVVTVGKGAAGKVAVKLTKGKATKRAAGQVKKNGKATIALPKAKGAWKAAVTFRPSKATYRAAKKTVTVRVR